MRTCWSTDPRRASGIYSGLPSPQLLYVASRCITVPCPSHATSQMPFGLTLPALYSSRKTHRLPLKSDVALELMIPTSYHLVNPCQLTHYLCSAGDSILHYLATLSSGMWSVVSLVTLPYGLTCYLLLPVALPAGILQLSCYLASPTTRHIPAMSASDAYSNQSVVSCQPLSDPVEVNRQTSSVGGHPCRLVAILGIPSRSVHYHSSGSLSASLVCVPGLHPWSLPGLRPWSLPLACFWLLLR